MSFFDVRVCLKSDVSDSWIKIRIYFPVLCSWYVLTCIVVVNCESVCGLD